tara:strand:+ start:726 stop:1091 length:366 start_codon:yes stop_codon:yes gene_type:complete
MVIANSGSELSISSPTQITLNGSGSYKVESTLYCQIGSGASGDEIFGAQLEIYGGATAYGRDFKYINLPDEWSSLGGNRGWEFHVETTVSKSEASSVTTAFLTEQPALTITRGEFTVTKIL